VLEGVAEDRSRRRNEFIDRYAPVFIALAAAFLFFVAGTVLIMRVHNRNQRRATEAPYVQAMDNGKQWVGLGDYGNAALCFRSALQIRPGDTDATRWLTQAQNVQRQSAAYAELNRETLGGKWIPGGAANPFSPTPIGGNPPPVAGVLMPAAPEPPMFPDVAGPSRRGNSDTRRNPRGTANDNDGGFLPGEAPSGPTAPPPGGNTGSTVIASEPSRPRGTIVIEAVDVPQRPARAATTEEDPEQYRQQALELKRQGNRQGAASAFRKAIQATQDSSQPAAVKKATINSMQQYLNGLEGSGP